MTIKDAVTMVLIYTNNTNDLTQVQAALGAFMPEADESVPKSIRFVNSEKEIKKISSAITSTSENLADTGITGYKYTILKEKDYRFAFLSEKFDKEFAVRLFTDESAYSRFKSNSKIATLVETGYKSARILEYRAGESSVVRYAVFAPKDIDFDVNEFTNTMSNYTNAGSTSFFSK